VGWRAFLCAPGSKLPAIPSAHPRADPSQPKCRGECGAGGHGLWDATTDHGKITAWFRAMPQANVAIRTGAPGPDVLDIDRKADGTGFPALNKLIRAELVPPSMAKIRTPSGGAHYYFKGTSQGNSSLSKSHVDYRGLGGYVLAPPSQVGGKPYELVEHGPARETFDWSAAKQLLEPAPERPAREARPDGTDADGLVRWVAACTSGVNAKLFWAANRAIEKGRTDLLPALTEAAYAAGEDRHGQPERTVESALRTATPFVKAIDREAGG
jgi:hypothetical protein